LERDLDIMNLIEMIKSYRVMQKVLFDQDQLLFLRFQRRDVLVATSEDTTSESDSLVQNLFDGVDDHSRDESRQIIRKRL